MNKFWALVISTHGLTRMWLSTEDVAIIMKNEYMSVLDVYRTGTDQRAILTKDDKIVWQDVSNIDFKVG